MSLGGGGDSLHDAVNDAAAKVLFLLYTSLLKTVLYIREFMLSLQLAMKTLMLVPELLQEQTECNTKYLSSRVLFFL